MRGLLTSLVFATTMACSSTPPYYDDCRELLEVQSAAWNRGDIDAFCDGYHKSEDLVFMSTSGVNVGWDAMHTRYKTRYPDKAAMGHLDFSDLGFTELGNSHVAARGRWQLTREKDKPSGHFVLVFRKFDDGWKIVADYTTSDSDD